METHRSVGSDADITTAVDDGDEELAGDQRICRPPHRPEYLADGADIIAWSQQVERGVVHDERRRCHGNRRAGVSSSPRAQSTVRYASRTASAWRIVGPTSAENSSR